MLEVDSLLNRKDEKIAAKYFPFTTHRASQHTCLIIVKTSSSSLWKAKQSVWAGLAAGPSASSTCARLLSFQQGLARLGRNGASWTIKSCCHSQKKQTAQSSSTRLLFSWPTCTIFWAKPTTSSSLERLSSCRSTPQDQGYWATERGSSPRNLGKSKCLSSHEFLKKSCC